MFVPNTPNERSNYATAVKNATEAFKTTPDLAFYVVTKEDLARETDYNVQGAFQGLEKLLKAMKSTHTVVKGKDDGTPVVAITR
jgi:hypothetical protein